MYNVSDCDVLWVIVNYYILAWKILGRELERVVISAIWLIHAYAHFLVSDTASSSSNHPNLIQVCSNQLPDFCLALRSLPGAHVEAKSLLLVAA